MHEVAVVFGQDGEPLHWHDAAEASAVAIPDTRTMWEAIWANRAVIGGVAHTHPGSGPPTPSNEDVTTWSAVERGLGCRLDWPIATRDAVAFFRWEDDAYYAFVIPLAYIRPGEQPWLQPLRERSFGRRP